MGRSTTGTATMRSVRFVLMFCLYLSAGAMLQAQPERTSAPHNDQILERRDDSRGRDSSFQVAAFPVQEKVFSVTFNNADMVADPVLPKDLVVMEDPANAYCSNRTIRNATVDARLKMGPVDYEFGLTQFTVTVILKIDFLDVQSNVLRNHLCTLKIDASTLDARPEQLYRRTFTDIYNNVDRIRISITSYTKTLDPALVAALESNIRLEAIYREEFDLPGTSTNAPAAPAVEIETLPKNEDEGGMVVANPVTFKWHRTAECEHDNFPNYQFQLLRLFNRSEANPANDETMVLETVDWGRAFTLETGNDHTELTLTISEGRGYYVWRVRPIGDKEPGGIANDRNWGVWSIAPAQGATIDIKSINDAAIAAAYPGAVFFYRGFDRDKNWIYGRTFTEGLEGTRIAEQITYATSLLQASQNQKHMESSDTLLVNQTVYDYTGRPALTTLPAPIDWSGFAYQSGFVQNNVGGLYTASNFDVASVGTNNWNNPEPTKAGGPLDRYYSDDNPDTRIPNADHYPFTRTLFYPDATGRPREAGGPGAAFRIGGSAGGTDRTMKTYYGAASDDELLVLFGDETPAASTVARIVTEDQNKVTSIQYVSREGKTLATCLAYKATTVGCNLTELIEVPLTQMINDHVTENHREGEGSIVSSKGVTLIVPTSVTVDYSVWPKELSTACPSYCASCDYQVEFLAIPMEDPGAVIKQGPFSISPVACDGQEGPAWTKQVIFSNLQPGTYTFAKRLLVNTIDPVSGRPYREVHGLAVENAVYSQVQNHPVLVQMRAYLQNANIEGLYTYLDARTPADGVIKNGDNYTVVTPCCSLTIERKHCDPKPSCDPNNPDFEKVLYDFWGPGAYTYGEDNRNFGDNLDKYFFTQNEQPLYKPGGNAAKGKFNLMIKHMIVGGGYDCVKLWNIWLGVVKTFARDATDEGCMDPNRLKGGYNLLEEFLTRAGKRYAGPSDCEFGDCSTQGNGYGLGYLEYAYEYFPYTSAMEQESEGCRGIYIGLNQGVPKPLVVNLAGNDVYINPNWGPDALTDAPQEKKWEQFYNCLTRRGNPSNVPIDVPIDCDPPNSIECMLALKATAEKECSTKCEQKRNAFRNAIVDAYHKDGKTVERDKYTLTGELIGPGFQFDITWSQVECLAGILVGNCIDSCKVTDVRDGANQIIAIGTADEIVRMRHAMYAAFEVALPVGGVCPQGDGWVHVASPHSALDYARSVAAELNRWLREYRGNGGDVNTASVTAQEAWEAYRDYTGDNSGACTWYSRNTSPAGGSDPGCCPPAGQPKIFTLGENIEGQFIANGCTLIYVRRCTLSGVEMVQRDTLCTNICGNNPCGGANICFRWRELVSPDTLWPATLLTCEERLAREIRNELNRQTVQCATERRAAIETQYTDHCTLPENVRDDMVLTYPLSRYHFTLYYYDRAGRLVRTVPPAGVRALAPGATRAMHPNHVMVTTYEHNTLDQAVRSRTPDANTSRAWFDSKSRSRFTQTFEQLGRNAFGYVKYDALGRTIETGEGIYANESELTTNADNMTWPNVGTADVFRTTYTTAMSLLPLYEPTVPARARSQRYLRNRISRVEAMDGSMATTYSYDPHGHVEWIVQYIRGLGDNYIRYEYDLVSGNPLVLHYNEGLGDQLTQRWFYDEDNRITRVESSRDGNIWDRDASYYYYAHGTVRRVEYGEDSLQGVDYTQTLNGWLKGINQHALAPQDDPGLDGHQALNQHAKYAVDAYGMQLTYFDGDFRRRHAGGGGTVHSPFNSATTGGYTVRADHLSTGGADLYNSNVATWTNNLMPAPPGQGGPRSYEWLTGEVYEYDRLNRLLAGKFNDNTGTWTQQNDYSSSYIYDPNGNIRTLVRNGVAAKGYQAMDDLAYGIMPNTNNRLIMVVDRFVTPGTPADYENRPPVPGWVPGPNFQYDGSGRLVGDRNERITNIAWTSYDRVRAVQKLGGGQLRFGYDAQGNRIKKVAMAGGPASTSYYVREAGGKVIAIYTKPCVDGADRMGGADGGGCQNPAGPTDTDHDGVPDAQDNAPILFNPDQRDTDGDGMGDGIEWDRDNDGLRDGPPSPYPDPCPFDATNQCDLNDKDGDGIPNASDPCPETPGTGGADRDNDRIPDGCDMDLDGDGVPNHEDNCPYVPNPDQVDANGNGIGDVCECTGGGSGGGGGGGCPPELAEQFVYGSEDDGRVVTVTPQRLRDMTDHAGDVTFTRELLKKEYELNDHLGNVRARLSDLKMSQGTAGTAPFKVDLRGYTNYYPFGMAHPDREYNITGGRYGYNGKEMDNDWNNGAAIGGVPGGEGNSYDYGFRMYEPRLGRFLSEDPLTAEYPSNSPYQYADNSPIAFIDIEGASVGSAIVEEPAKGVVIKILPGAKELSKILVTPGGRMVVGKASESLFGKVLGGLGRFGKVGGGVALGLITTHMPTCGRELSKQEIQERELLIFKKINRNYLPEIQRLRPDEELYLKSLDLLARNNDVTSDDWAPLGPSKLGGRILFIDENLSPSLGPLLEEKGYNVAFLPKGYDDEKDIIPWAKEKEAIILTNNVRDFRDAGLVVLKVNERLKSRANMDELIRRIEALHYRASSNPDLLGKPGVIPLGTIEPLIGP